MHGADIPVLTADSPTSQTQTGHSDMYDESEPYASYTQDLRTNGLSSLYRADDEACHTAAGLGVLENSGCSGVARKYPGGTIASGELVSS